MRLRKIKIIAFLGVGFMLSEALMPSVSALTRQLYFGADLTYQQDIGVNFTFNTSLQLTVSSDLVISNLAPNTASDSNVVNVNVSTNAVSGYKLTATVGNNTTYNTRNLVHTNSSLSNTFSSVAYAATPTITTNTNLTDNTWAYSYSTDNGSTWANYNGLPLYSDTENFATLKETTGPVSTASGDDIKFKIAAKASETQASGEYNNVINFNLVANPVPVTLSMAFEDAGKSRLFGFYQMQDMTPAIAASVDAIGEKIDLIDNRDGKIYSVAKLADGNVWMVENLDIAGGTALSSDDTDFESSYTLPNDWNVDNGKLILPPSDTYGFFLDNEANLYNSGSTNCGAESPCYSYYSWDTATLGSGRSITVDNQDAPYSICPKGWRLPTTHSGTNSDTDFRGLVIALGGTNTIDTYDDANNTSPSGTTVSAALLSSPNSFLYTGFYNNGGFYKGGSYGSYWSATTGDKYSGAGTYDKARALLFDSDTVYTAANLGRKAGYSVRCVAR